MDNNVSFRPVQGPEAKIASHELTKGYFYCATDSGKIYLDTDDRRIPLGGSGAAIYYGNADNDGEIGFMFYNFTDTTTVFEAGDKLGQGIFEKYFIVSNEAEITTERNGGFGSTGN